MTGFYRTSAGGPELPMEFQGVVTLNPDGTQATSGGGGGGGGDASAANQATQIARLDSILAELEGKADLGETQPVSLASAPLATGAATAALQSALNDLFTDTGNPGIDQADQLTWRELDRRRLIRAEHTKNFSTTTVTDASREIIATPGTGNRLVLIKIRAQNTTGNATRLRFTHFDTTTDIDIDVLNTSATDSGVSEVYPYEDWVRLPENTSLRGVPSADEAHDVSVIYYTESITTGLPV